MLHECFRLSSVLMIAAFSGMALGSNTDQRIRAEVGHALATPYPVDDPTVARFKLRFDIRLTNRSGAPAYVPKSQAANASVTRISVVGVQVKQRDGGWAYVVQSSWYDNGTIKYASCTLLPLDGTVEFTGLSGELLLLDAQLAKLGDTPTVRLSLMTFCRQEDGTVRSSSVTTDGFDIRLPLQR
jgi:hypothetical protein